MKPQRRRSAEVGRRVLRVENVVAAQAADLRGSIGLGRGTSQAYGFVRARVEALDEDHPTGQDFEAIATAITDGELRAALTTGRSS
jgi:histidine ammonia-lyase